MDCVSAVVGRGTPSRCPSSSARSRSFCIIGTLNKRLRRHAEDEGAAVLEHRRRDDALEQRLDGSLARDPGLLGEEHGLAEGQDLDGQAEVGSDLHGRGEAKRPHVGDGGPDGEQVRRARARARRGRRRP